MSEPAASLRAVLLDVDGTLVDSNDAHTRAWVEAMREQGYDVPYEKVRQLVGMGGDNLLPSALGLSKDSPDGHAIDQRQRQIFKESYLPAVRAFPGTRALLQRMLGDGLKLVIATSARPDELDPLLDRAGVADLVQARTSSADADQSKPSPDIVKAALQSSGYSPDQVVMIGDSPYDVQAAGRAGVRVIALRCGGFPDRDLAGAMAIFDDVADLLHSYERSPMAAAEPTATRAARDDERTRPVERPMDADRKLTTDHETIRRWTVERGGLPALVRRVGQPEQGELVLNFPDDGIRDIDDGPVVDISWSDFFQRFEDQGLALVYRDAPATEGDARAYEFVSRSGGGQ
jgi:HAD superfamily hydrolase (TIGR01509 family)